MNQKIFVAVAFTIFALTISWSADVTVTQRESKDRSASKATVSVSTMDRTFVPIIRESKETKVDGSTTRTDSVTRMRAIDGRYFDWLSSTTVERKVSPNVTETSQDIIEKDRQGDTRTVARVVETVTKTARGDTAKAVGYTRDATGEMVLDKEITAVSKKNPDGTISSERIEKEADVNGNLVRKREIAQTETKRGPNETVTTAEIKSFSHIEGRFAVTANETTTVRTEGKKTFTETVVRTPSRAGMTVDKKVTTTETRAADGTIQRETVEQGRSLFSKATGADIGEPLVPKWKSVEREVRKPDGTVVVQRDVYRRDVNGDWTPIKFSMETETGGATY